MRALDRRPLREAFVAAAEHPDLVVAPRLLADPVDRVVCVGSLALPGDDLVGAAGFAPGLHDDADVSACRGVTGLFHFLHAGIDREVQRGGETSGCISWPYDQRAQR